MITIVIFINTCLICYNVICILYVFQIAEENKFKSNLNFKMINFDAGDFSVTLIKVRSFFDTQRTPAQGVAGGTCPPPPRKKHGPPVPQLKKKTYVMSHILSIYSFVKYFLFP